MKKTLIIICSIFIILAAVASSLYALLYFNLIPRKAYTAEDFDIQTIKSQSDNDNDGVDDYTDIYLSARAYVKTKPKYKSAYYKGGYPPKEEGVCTDVIWQAFKGAGFNLKDMVDEDITENIEMYPGVNGTPDTNIDFRRVRNLHVFFERHAKALTNEKTEIAEWQPGDIAVFSGHIAIISDKRNKDGIPYIIHNGGRPVTEEDALSNYEIIGHYRWLDYFAG